MQSLYLASEKSRSKKPKEVSPEWFQFSEPLYGRMERSWKLPSSCGLGEAFKREKEGEV